MTKGKWMALFLLVAVLALGTPQAVMAQAQGSSGTGVALTVADSSGGAAAAPVPKYVPLGDDYPAQFALACAGAAGVALTGTFLAGPTEAIMLLGGGLLTPSNTLLMGLALMGQIGASSCVVGGMVAPTALWVYGESDKIWAKVTRSASVAGQQVIQTSSATGSAVLAALGLGSEPPVRQVAEGGSAAAQ